MDLCEMFSSLKPLLVILFGSYARGDYTNKSDIDVLIVSDILPKDPKEAFASAFKLSRDKVIPTVMNTEVFLARLKEGSTFLLEVIEDGKILCGDANFIKQVLEIYKEVRKKFRREGKLWSWE
nr:nucleotidyltransferase domain-containing protein [Sulfolobus sp. E11-6]